LTKEDETRDQLMEEKQELQKSRKLKTKHQKGKNREAPRTGANPSSEWGTSGIERSSRSRNSDCLLEGERKAREAQGALYAQCGTLEGKIGIKRGRRIIYGKMDEYRGHEQLAK